MLYCLYASLFFCGFRRKTEIVVFHLINQMVKIWAVDIAFKRLMVCKQLYLWELLIHCFLTHPLTIYSLEPFSLNGVGRRLLCLVFNPGKSFDDYFSLLHKTSHDRFTVLVDPLPAGLGLRLSRLARIRPLKTL